MYIGYSPYDMCNEALRLIKECSSKELIKDNEQQIIFLLNKAEEYPNMSFYQLALAHKDFADTYYKFGYTGSALEHYEIGLKMNSNLPVKRKIEKLKKIPSDELSYSLDANMIGEPDLANIRYYSSGIMSTYSPKDVLRNKIVNEIHSQLTKQAHEEDNIYDKEFEQMIEERLSKLDDLSRSEFYRLRVQRKNNGILSNKDIDILTLESMEKSYNYRNNK